MAFIPSIQVLVVYKKSVLFSKPYNLTYFIRLSAVAMFTGRKSMPLNRKPYKMYSK